ncbi:hypothetical protein ACFL4L_06350 [bacterium]
MRQNPNQIITPIWLKLVLIYFCITGWTYAQNPLTRQSEPISQVIVSSDTIQSEMQKFIVDSIPTARVLWTLSLHQGNDSLSSLTSPHRFESTYSLSDSKDSTQMVAQSDPLGGIGKCFSMAPVQPSRPEFFKKGWVKVGLVALATGVAGYMLRKEADRAYSSYISANSLESMNHYFDRAVLYDKLSSGFYIVCEFNVCFAMWMSVRSADR